MSRRANATRVKRAVTLGVRVQPAVAEQMSALAYLHHTTISDVLYRAVLEMVKQRQADITATLDDVRYQDFVTTRATA